jgi:hypothetical protein
MTKALLRKSEQIYGLVVRLYPQNYREEFGEEMKYVFSQSMRETMAEGRELEVARLWGRTIMDTIKTITIQHLEIQKGSKSMKTVSHDILMQDKVFPRIAFITGLLLLVPLAAMLLKTGVNWSLMDFGVAGFLIFGMSSLFVVMARKFQSPKQRIIIGLGCALLFLYVWAELAVGIFTN